MFDLTCTKIDQTSNKNKHASQRHILMFAIATIFFYSQNYQHNRCMPICSSLLPPLSGILVGSRHNLIPLVAPLGGIFIEIVDVLLKRHCLLMYVCEVWSLKVDTRRFVQLTVKAGLKFLLLCSLFFETLAC